MPDQQNTPPEQSVQVDTSFVTLDVADGTRMPAYVARPWGDVVGPGIIVLQEAFGVNGHIRSVAERFALAGYVAIAPALFHRTGGDFEGSYSDFASVMPHMQALTDEGQAADIRAAYDWLTAADSGRASQVVSVGYCMGGRTSFLACATVPLKAAASYYGGGIAPSPHRLFPDLLSRASDLTAPMLLIWGGKDSHITQDQVRAVEDALRSAGKDYAQVVFSYADHAFFNDVRPNYEPNASRQAWALTLSFFQSYLHTV
jgi:carboxymethylenebutenolidase